MPSAAPLEQRRIGGMNTRIGSPDTVVVTVTAPATAGRPAALVTGGAVFHVPPRRFTVILPPRKQGMVHRHPNFLLVAIGAKARSLMALPTVGLFPGSLKTVGESKVQVVDISLEVVSSMALQAAGFATMTGGAPLSLGHCSFTVSMAPILAVDVGQGGAFPVAELTGVVSNAAIVTIHTQRLAGPERIIDRFAQIYALVTTQAGHVAGKVKLVIEFKFVGLKVAARLLRIMVAHIAGFIVLDIVTIATGTHVGQVVVGTGSTALYLRVAYIAGCFRFTDMEGVRENDITLRLDRGCLFTGDGIAQGSDQYRRHK